METTTRSSGDDGTGATRRASGSEGRVAIPRDTPRPALPHMFPQMLPQTLQMLPQSRVTPNVPPEPLCPKCYPRALKCCPRAALPQMFPQSRFTPNVTPNATLEPCCPNVTLEPRYPKCYPEPCYKCCPRAKPRRGNDGDGSDGGGSLGPACWRATRDAGRRRCDDDDGGDDDDWSDDSPN